MVIGKLTGYLALGLIGAFLINTLVRPQAAAATGSALQQTGAGIGAIGQGIGASLAAIGSGGARLFQPLWELKNLIYDSNVAGAASVGPTSQHEGTTNQGTSYPSSGTNTWSSGAFNYYSDQSISPVPIADVSVHGQDLSLSADAIKFYRDIGVEVT